MPTFLERIKASLEPQSNQVPADVQHQLRLATGALLMEMCRADFKVMPEERRSIANAIRKGFELNDEEIHDLLDAAETEANCAVSLQMYTSLINQYCPTSQKSDLVRDLWRVAYADGELHQLEDVLVRRVAALLQVPDKQVQRLHDEVVVSLA